MSQSLARTPGATQTHLPSVIRAKGVSKRFAVAGTRGTSLKERFVARAGGSTEPYWALRDVNAEIPHGQTVGLIGANGSGKSTLLKVLAGILEATEGEVSVEGRVASLLELGAGFNGELSGRDNVYLNASLLGLSRRETDALFDSIVEFSELGRKIEEPVKYYSSGQYIRLGFAIAVHVDPDVLLVDEVLAVGDEAFQRKCLARIRQFRDEGRTILFVSHSLDLVDGICDRALVLEAGRLIFDGDVRVGTALLRRRLGAVDSDAEESGGTLVRPTGITFSSEPAGPQRVQYELGEPLCVSVALEADEGAPERIYLHVAVTGPHRIPVWVMETPEGGIPGRPGTSTVDFVVPELPALLGAFSVVVYVSDAQTGEPLAENAFDDLFGVSGSQGFGLLRLDYDSRLRE